MDYEEILRSVGKMGRYQIYLLCLSFVACGNAGIHLFNIVFTMGMPKHRCAVPGLQNDTFNIQDETHATLVQAAIPFDPDKGGYSKCSLYKVSLDSMADELLNTTTFETEDCTRWVYSKDVFASSIVSELNLVCDRQIYMSHANMMSMAGIMVITMVTGTLSDRWGRKTLLVIHNWLVLAASIAVVYVKSEVLFLILRFVEVGTCMATFMCMYGLVTEISAPSKRAVGTTIIMGGWTVGMLVVILVAFFVRDWKLLHLILSSPLLLTGIAFPFLIPESPKWLLSRKRYSQAEAILQTIARVNGKSLSIDLDLSAAVLEPSHKSAGSFRGLLLLFRSPILAFRLLILAIGWIVNAMVYYGVGLNLGTVIPGDIYINFFVITVSSLVTLPLAVWILVSKGRKIFFCLCMVLGGVFCIGTMFPILGSDDLSWMTTLLCFIGKLLLTLSFMIIWLYTNELLPTTARLSGVGFCNFFGRIGALVSPYIATLPTVVDGKLGQALPLLVFGICGLVSGTLSLLLPETGNGKLPDTVREAELLQWRTKRPPCNDHKTPTRNGKQDGPRSAGSELL